MGGRLEKTTIIADSFLAQHSEDSVSQSISASFSVKVSGGVGISGGGGISGKHFFCASFTHNLQAA